MFLLICLANSACDQIHRYDAATPDAGTDADAVADSEPTELVLEVIAQPVVAYDGLPLFPVPTIKASGPDSAMAKIALSVKQGDGKLNGTTQLTATDGVAAFVGLIYSSKDAQVVLEARSGDAHVALQPFDVIAPPPGACRADDDNLMTAEGGCHDRKSGLTWSSVQKNANWHDAVWDATVGPEPDDDDFGRTNDYPPETGCSNLCDNSVLAACHTLTEGGYGDWRLPTVAEFELLKDSLAGSDQVSLPKNTDRAWTSNSTSNDLALRYSLAEGRTAVHGKATASTVICVRGGRKPATRLFVSAAPLLVGSGKTTPFPLVVFVVDDDGTRVNAQDLEVALESASGELLGELSATTDVVGRAAFDVWSLSATATPIVMTASAPGLQSASTEVIIGTERHTCQEHANFETAEGGCMSKLTGLVFSAPILSRTWHESIWDSESPHVPPGPSRAPEPNDGDARNDYDPKTVPIEEGRDQAPLDACHQLVEGGHADWRVPTQVELTSAHTAGATDAFGFPTNYWFWTSTVAGGANLAYVVKLSKNLETDSHLKTMRHMVICVRNPT